jgi:zinc transport system permease protein
MDDVSFWESAFLWRDAIIVAALCAAVLSYLGVWVSLKRVVYVPLALSQVAGFGVVLSFWFCSALDLHDTPTPLAPESMSLVLATATAFYFARPKALSDHATVVAYLIASASALLMSTFVRQDVHDVQSVLFGNAVLVETVQIAYVGAAALAVAAVHLLRYRRFLFVSFDADTAAASGFSVYGNEVFMYVTFAVMISVATRAIGALPAFGFTALPALAALTVASSMRSAFFVSVGIGVICAVAGYYLSFVWELPTGATMVALAGGVYLVAHLRSIVPGQR